jgi:hypothetical protein
MRSRPTCMSRKRPEGALHKHRKWEIYFSTWTRFQLAIVRTAVLAAPESSTLPTPKVITGHYHKTLCHIRSSRPTNHTGLISYFHLLSGLESNVSYEISPTKMLYAFLVFHTPAIRSVPSQPPPVPCPSHTPVRPGMSILHELNAQRPVFLTGDRNVSGVFGLSEVHFRRRVAALVVTLI